MKNPRHVASERTMRPLQLPLADFVARVVRGQLEARWRMVDTFALMRSGPLAKADQ